MSNKIWDTRAINILIANILVKSWKNVFQIFLNIFIWKQTQDIQIVAQFNLIYLITHMIFFTLFAPVVKQWYRNILHVFSLVWFACVYLGIMYLWESAIHHLILIPFAIGFFNSIYWITYHNTQFDLTTHANRWNFEGIRKSLRITASIITPVVVWFLISFNYFWYWYQTAFALWAFLFLIWAYIWASAPKVVDPKPFQLVSVIKSCLKQKDVRRSLWTYSLTSFSFSNSVIEVLIPIILFSYISNEFQIGSLISFFAIISIILSYCFGKFISYKFYSFFILVFWLLYAISLSGFVFFTKLEYLIIFSTCITVFAHLFSLPQKVMSDNVLHKLQNYKDIRSEYMVLREWFQAVGWIWSFTVIYFAGSIETEFIQFIFGAMIIAVVICSVLLSRVDIYEK